MDRACWLGAKYRASYEGAFSRGEITGKGTYRTGTEHNYPADGRLHREYVGEFYKGCYHGHGTLKFSLYVDQDLRIIDQEDLWDVYKGYFRYRKMDGARQLTYNHSPLSWQDPSSDIAPPAVLAF